MSSILIPTAWSLSTRTVPCSPSIDADTVENEYAEDMYQCSELDWLIYNDPMAYADLVLNGDVEGYLKRVTQYRPLNEQ